MWFRLVPSQVKAIRPEVSSSISGPGAPAVPWGVTCFQANSAIANPADCCIVAVPVPFLNAYERAIHFSRHGHEFGAATEHEYEQMADGFMRRTLSPILQECIRTIRGEQDRVRLHFDTGHFGVAYRRTILRTFHIKSQAKMRNRGGAANLLAYECGRIDL